MISQNSTVAIWFGHFSTPMNDYTFSLLLYVLHLSSEHFCANLCLFAAFCPRLFLPIQSAADSSKCRRTHHVAKTRAEKTESRWENDSQKRNGKQKQFTEKIDGEKTENGWLRRGDGYVEYNWQNLWRHQLTVRKIHQQSVVVCQYKEPSQHWLLALNVLLEEKWPMITIPSKLHPPIKPL